MIQSPEVSNRISQLRLKMTAGTITQEELKEGILILRAGRKSASEASKASKARKGPVKSADELLNELGDLG
jgi:hypothetical protein